MIRKLRLIRDFRLLPKDFGAGVELGLTTVIYGHNASGKTTLAQALLGATADAPDGGSDLLEISYDNADTALNTVHVFTDEWINANIGQFLQGDDGPAIVTLGRAAKDNESSQAKVASELETLEVERQAAKTESDVAKKATSSIIVQAQNEIERHLGIHHPGSIKHKFRKDLIEQWLSEDGGNHKVDLPSLMKALGNDELSAVISPSNPPTLPDGLIQDALALVSTVPQNERDSDLDNSDELRQWVLNGIELHAQRSACGFCKATLSAERLGHLGQYFDESWRNVQRRASELEQHLADAKARLARWRDSVPQPALLDASLQAEYRTEFDLVMSMADSAEQAINRLLYAVGEKSLDPSRTPDVESVEQYEIEIVLSGLSGVLERQQQVVDNRLSQRELALTDAARAIVASYGDNYRVAVSAETVAEKRLNTIVDDVRTKESLLNKLRSEQFTTNEAASGLTNDLQSVFGKGHLSIELSGDGKSYTCVRGEVPAVNLSTGERNVLALAYFLRSLTSVQTGDLTAATIVIDDPSSSLDQESVFAMNRAISSLRPEGSQLIVLTHDLNLLRLMTLGLRNAWSKERDATAAATPTGPEVQFLQMRSLINEGKRSSRMDLLPDWMIRRPTEYFYLFGTLLEAVGESARDDSLPLVPNSARRLIESFVAHRAPAQSGQLRNAIEYLTRDSDDSFIDVYHFCNEYSHGEVVDTVKLPSLETLRTQIRRSLEFIKQIDAQHYEGMCKAVRVRDPLTTLNQA